MLEQDDHFKHLYDNPTYIRPNDWREIDTLVDWLIEKNKAGYQMVNSVQRLREIKAFVRITAALISTYSYHPTNDRDLSTAASVRASEVEFDTLNNPIKEFWPDIRRGLHRSTAHSSN